MSGLLRCLASVKDEMSALVVEVVGGTPEGVREKVERLSQLRSELERFCESGEELEDEEKEKARSLVSEIKELQSNLRSVIKDSQDFLRFLYETIVMVDAPGYDREGSTVKKSNVVDRRA